MLKWITKKGADGGRRLICALGPPTETFWRQSYDKQWDCSKEAITRKANICQKRKETWSLSHISFLYVHFLQHQSTDSSDEETLHIDTEAKPEVKSRNSKVKKKSGSAAGILDLLQASKQVGGIDYGTNR